MVCGVGRRLVVDKGLVLRRLDDVAGLPLPPRTVAAAANAAQDEEEDEGHHDGDEPLLAQG
jgi:hypothetical protein